MFDPEPGAAVIDATQNMIFTGDVDADQPAQLEIVMLSALSVVGGPLESAAVMVFTVKLTSVDATFPVVLPKHRP